MKFFETSIEGAKGAMVHPFLVALGVVPEGFVDLEPKASELPAWLYGIPYHHSVGKSAMQADFLAMALEKYRKALPQLYGQESAFVRLVKKQAALGKTARELRVPFIPR